VKLPYKKLAIALPLVFIIVELGVRATGLTDFPLYDANSEIGYIPSPSQSGSFLHKNSWEFNSLSMGAGPFKPTEGVNTLLIGDSIVLGGNPYRQADRLGPTLQRVSNNTVWPISAGSWSLRNELIYLRTHPEVLRNIDNFIFVLNSEDFQQASSWGCETTHPRSYPISAAYYVFQKYVFNIHPCTGVLADLSVKDGDWREEVKDFIAHEHVEGKSVKFFLYPKKSEASAMTLAESNLEVHAANLMQETNKNVRVFSVVRDTRWSPKFYRDDIHPSVEGTQILASIINSPDQGIELK